ncbi:hypothetical protein ONZ51_g11969 [Trametes cubensis]|uniref:Uncharacterized protein n=1 Tax=Trametes cubensis TaxID=1111947 RepID=A0AAD7X5T9_9APHY|nr:hypothetical protein ONZ51_g11969 [Trametes cubensis]
MPQQQLVTLENSPHSVLCPFYVAASINNNLILCFALSEHRGSEKRYICCVRRTPLNLGARPLRPLLLEITGQIAVNNCFLTAHGHKDPERPDDDSEPTASCWLEARPDTISRTYWRSVLPTVHSIMEHIPGEVDISGFVSVAADGTVRLQVIWEASEDETIETALPMFNENENRCVPRSISEVPFGVCMRAIFTVEYHYDSNSLGPSKLFASLVRIERV